ncbi:LytR/AlgR family response regulator transcription factor [Faecalibaculum rodentium]|uniref:LytR/AlgR family response regulator transcription factor n=1 Tax=Faecalibaculum rodentium TaxID=1702221 RepID=UPI00258D692D|nr:LytTR family DNA-binding domain-containing protein [Faecalibaculum rodentium]
MKRVIIISDEPAIRNQLAERVKAILGDQTKIRLQTGKDAALQIRDADLILIHTRMSRASSLEVAKRMKKENPAALLVFFSENQEDVDFILGSEFDSFLWLNDSEDRLPAMLQTFSRRYADRIEHFIRVKRRNRRQLLPKNRILYVERDYRKIIFHMEDGEQVSVYSTMDEVLQELDDSYLRIHNSYVVQEKAIRELHRDFLKLKDGSLIPVSRTYAARAKQRIFPDSNPQINSTPQ